MAAARSVATNQARSFEFSNPAMRFPPLQKLILSWYAFDDRVYSPRHSSSTRCALSPPLAKELGPRDLWETIPSFLMRFPPRPSLNLVKGQSRHIYQGPSRIPGSRMSRAFASRDAKRKIGLDRSVLLDKYILTPSPRHTSGSLHLCSN